MVGPAPVPSQVRGLSWPPGALELSPKPAHHSPAPPQHLPQVPGGGSESRRVLGGAHGYHTSGHPGQGLVSVWGKGLGGAAMQAPHPHPAPHLQGSMLMEALTLCFAGSQPGQTAGPSTSCVFNCCRLPMLLWAPSSQTRPPSRRRAMPSGERCVA